MMTLSQKLKTVTDNCDSLFDPGLRWQSHCIKKALVVNLRNKTTSDFDIPKQWAELYVSGPALGARLFAHFSNDNGFPVVLTAPVTDSGDITTIAFSSPQTGKLHFNRIKGSFGRRLALCGYDALIVVEESVRLCAVSLSPAGCQFADVQSLSGLSTQEVPQMADTSDLLIGPAGENRVEFANAVCDGSSTGRGGLGCVFGGKRLKALSVSSYLPESSEEDPKSVDINMVRLAKCGLWAPVCNFTGRTDPRLFHLSVKETRRIIARKAIDCKEPPFEAVLMLGSNTGCFDIEKVIARYSRCLSLGLDPVSVGAYLGVLKCDSHDEQSVMDLISQMSVRDPSCAVYRTDGIETGPYDYRGNFTQALCDAFGAPDNIFNASEYLCRNSWDLWACLSEDIVRGLECFGLDRTSVLRRISKTGRASGLVLEKLPALAGKLYQPSEDAKELSLFYSRNVKASEIVTMGLRAKRLIWDINAVLGVTDGKIPDHFCIDPENTSEDLSVVPMGRISSDYVQRVRLQFASQPVRQKDRPGMREFYDRCLSCLSRLGSRVLHRQSKSE